MAKKTSEVPSQTTVPHMVKYNTGWSDDPTQLTSGKPTGVALDANGSFDTPERHDCGEFMNYSHTTGSKYSKYANDEPSKPTRGEKVSLFNDGE